MPDDVTSAANGGSIRGGSITGGSITGGSITGGAVPGGTAAAVGAAAGKGERSFIPCNIAVLTVSDSRTEETDTSGATLVARLTEAGHRLADRRILPDDQPGLEAQLRRWIADPAIDIVIATGGTGVTGRDVTPEAFAAVWEKEISGFGELFRMLSYQKIGTSTVQSRATAGVAGGTYLFALPGSTGACKDGWDMILKDQLDYRHKPCNFVELLPRLEEHQRRK